MKLRTLLCCLAAAMALTLCAWTPNPNILDSGFCGDNVRWTLENNGVLTISGDGAMYNWSRQSRSPWDGRRSTIVSVVINDGVSAIGDWAFEDCYQLASVTIPDSVTVIGERAFSNCSKLASVEISENVTAIGDGAFAYCKNMENISVHSANQHYISEIGVLFDKSRSTLICYPAKAKGPYEIPGGVAVIGNFAFTLCDALTSVTIPDSVTAIGNYAFVNCSGLTGVTIPDSVTSIGEYAFQSCSRLTDVAISGNAASIEHGAFYGCANLTDVTIPDSVTSVGDFAFASCRNLKAVAIPDSVTSIGAYAFNDCASLTTVTIPDGVTSISVGAFKGCASLTTVTIPDGVISIAAEAFYSCASLTGVTIPDSVTSIGLWAFGSCENLTGVTIPDSVTAVAYGAFQGCASLTDVYYGGSAAQWLELCYWWSQYEELKNATIHYNAKDIGIGITLSDKNGDTIDANGRSGKKEEEKKDAFQDDAEFKAKFDAVDPDNSSGIVSASVFVIFYDRDGFMVSLEQKEIDLSDPFNLLFVLNIHVPEGAKTLKFLMLGDNFEPLRAVRLIESTADAA